MIMKDRKFNKTLMNNWITAHNPYGAERLAMKSGISVSLIRKINSEDYVPTKLDTLEKIAKALKVEINDLFL